MERRGGLAVADEGFGLKLAQESSAIRQEIAGVRADLRAEIATLRAEMATRKELEAVRQDMAAGFARLERQISDSRVESIKWSFLFWTGQCLTIIGFLVVFLRNR